MRKQERRNTVYVGFIDLENAYNRVNREALLHVLGICDVGDKLFMAIETVCIFV